MTKLKKLDNNNIKHACQSLDNENGFLNPIWMWGQITPDINLLIIFIFHIKNNFCRAGII